MSLELLVHVTVTVTVTVTFDSRVEHVELELLCLSDLVPPSSALIGFV
jgi:hypothetical protein